MSRSRLRGLSVLVALAGAVGVVRGADVDKYLPEGTQVLVTVNVRQILESPLVKKDLPKMRQGLEGLGDAKKILDDLGFDPFKDLDTLTIAGAGAGDPEKAVAVAHGRFNVGKFQAKAEEVAKEQGFLKVQKTEGHTLYEVTPPGQDKPAYLALVDAHTIVASPSKEIVLQAFAAQPSTATAKVRGEFKTLLEKADDKQSIWIVGLGSALAKGIPQGEQIKHLVGGITFSDDLRAEFTILAVSDSAAKELAKTIEDGIEQAKSFLTIISMDQKQLTPLVGLLDKIKVAGQGATVSVKGHVNKETLEKLEKQP